MSKLNSEYYRPRGLRNLGNTCFLNSIIQALASCPPFLNYLKSIEDCNQFASDLFNCIENIRESDRHDAHTASYLLDTVQEFNQHFEGFEQQDAHELFQVLIKLIIDENEAPLQLKSFNIYSPSLLQDKPVFMNMATLGYIEGKRNYINCQYGNLALLHNKNNHQQQQQQQQQQQHIGKKSTTSTPSSSSSMSMSMSVNSKTNANITSTKINQNIINDNTNTTTTTAAATLLNYPMIEKSDIPFKGLLATRIECQRCKKLRPTKIQSFHDISLTIPLPTSPTTPNKFSTNKVSGKNMPTMDIHSTIITLDDCIKNYLKMEILEDLNCPMCTARDEKKQMEYKCTLGNTNTSVKSETKNGLTILPSATTTTTTSSNQNLLNISNTMSIQPKMNSNTIISKKDPNTIANRMIYQLLTNTHIEGHFDSISYTHDILSDIYGTSTVTSSLSMIKLIKLQHYLFQSMNTKSIIPYTSNNNNSSSSSSSSSSDGNSSRHLQNSEQISNSTTTLNNHTKNHDSNGIVDKDNNSSSSSNSLILPQKSSLEKNDNVTSSNPIALTTQNGTTRNTEINLNSTLIDTEINTNIDHKVPENKSKIPFTSILNFCQHIRTIKSTAYKYMYFTRLPPILCFHINRQVIDPRTGYLKKIHAKIEFPFDLDMSIYTSYPGINITESYTTSKELSTKMNTNNATTTTASISSNNVSNNKSKQNRSSTITTTTPFSTTTSDTNNITPEKTITTTATITSTLHTTGCIKSYLFSNKIDHKYELYAVITHLGENNSGHYVAYVRGESKSRWYAISDETVSPISADRVRHTEAYMLFYIRKTYISH